MAPSKIEGSREGAHAKIGVVENTSEKPALFHHFEALVRKQECHGRAALAAVEAVAELESIVENDYASLCGVVEERWGRGGVRR